MELVVSVLGTIVGGKEGATVVPTMTIVVVVVVRVKVADVIMVVVATVVSSEYFLLEAAIRSNAFATPQH